MCGIAGWVGRELEHDARACLDAMRHRGPDASGVEHVDEVVLCHTRLKVIDLSDAGRQPMRSQDGTVVVVFNGEIYNHRELRSDLAGRGHRFRGHSDTEVIAPLYLEHGDRFVEHLRGMFAIALYDRTRRRIVLARDRFGIKPLYWAETREGVAFASEIRVLTRMDSVDSTIDHQAVADYISLHYIPPPATMYAGVRALEPGCMLVADVSGDSTTPELRRYHQWSVNSRATPADLDLAADEAGALLDRAVSSQLESDVPLGGLLSGGIDSGLVCQAAVSRTDGFKTFGVSFEDPEFDERPGIEAAAAAIGSDHRTTPFGDTVADWDHVLALVRASGQPFADTSILAVDALCRTVRSHVTVALSGDGGDEAFSGYDHFGRLYGLLPFARMPPGVRSKASSALAWSFEHLPRLSGSRIPSQVPERLRDLATTASLVDIVADHTSWIRRREHQELWTGPEVLPVNRLFAPTWDPREGRSSPIDALFDLMTEADVRLRLAGDFLPKIDVASMRQSLEVRVPMLDEDLFGFGLSLPRELRRPRPGPGKRTLRRLAERRLPAIARLPKHGFGVPFDRWVDDGFRGSMRDMFSAGAKVDEWIRPEYTEGVVAAFCEGSVPAGLTRQGLYQRAYMLLALETHLQG